jgi:8-oxo-dGTP pyrophosphatase MutT (NUDIX family)
VGYRVSSSGGLGPVAGGSGDPEVDRLAAAIAGHVPDDPREDRSRTVILDHLRTLEHPFDRYAAPTHVTASAVVVGPRGVLLHRHRRLHRWLQPGGHLDPGERPEDGARRECEEETGLTVEHPVGGPVLVHVDVHGSADDHLHLDVRYLLVGPDAEPSPPPTESQDVAWFTWDQADAVADEALVGALRAARRLIDTGTVEISGGTPEEGDG